MAKAKRKLTAAEVWSAFCALDMNDQQEIVDRLPAGQLLTNPYIAMYLDADQMELQHERDKRKHSKSAEMERTAALRSEGLSGGQIAKQLGVKKATAKKRLQRLKKKSRR